MAFIQRIQRGQPQNTLVNFRNTEASTAITIGQPVCFDMTTDADGVGVLLPTTAHLQFPAGLMVSASVAADDYGSVITKGYFASGAVEGTTAVAIGDPLKITNATAYLVKNTVTANFIGAYQGCFVAGVAQAAASVVASKVIVNC